MTLLDQHAAQLRASGLTDATIASAGIYSVTDPAEAARLLGWQGSSGPAPALAFPILGRDGSLVGTAVRPDKPHVRRDGRAPKYEWPAGAPARIYFAPPVMAGPAVWSNIGVPLLVTEGVKKALSAAQAGAQAPVAAMGVTLLHDTEARRNGSGWKLHPDLLALPLKGRRVFLAFDGGDTTENAAVILAEAQASRWFREAGAEVWLLRIPFVPGGPKIGLDDFLANEADPALALERLQGEAIPADPLRCARALRQAPGDRQVAVAQSLIAAPYFVAGLHVGGKLLVDLVHKEIHQAAGVTKAALQEAIDGFRSWLASKSRSAVRADEGAATDSDIPYRTGQEGTVWFKPTKDGPIPVQLANFSAKIVSDVTEDDGVESHRTFDIEGTLHGRSRRFQISAQRFRSCDWAVENLGAEAVVWPEFGARERLPAAVQLLSGQIPTRTVHTHTGWRRFTDVWGYLHGGGAIGPNGPLVNVEVALPADLRRYALPEPPTGSELVRAIRGSLGMLDVAPARIMFALHGAIWRALVGPVDFSIHMAGQTGAGKTELAALAQQHFGAGLDARHLPGSWSSTGNALESMASAIADAVLTVDDFCPVGSSYDLQRLHASADRLLRSQGNGAGRHRLRSDTSLRPARVPRGLIVSTGEETPSGQSLRARMVCLEVGPKDVDWPTLTRCQGEAAEGLYAGAVAAFVQRLAGRRDDLIGGMKTRIAELRQRATGAGTAHRRTPEIVANLHFGFDLFLSFAVEAGALSASEADQLRARCWEALGEAAAAQAGVQAEAEPTQRFLSLLTTAVTSGRAHIASRDGGAPPTPAAFGWRDGKPLGRRVGWTDGADLFLDRDGAFAAANEVGQANGSPLLLSAPTLAKRLGDKGLLLATDTGRNRLQVRVTLEGTRRVVLHLAAASLISTEPAQSAQSSDGATEGPLPEWPGPHDGPLPGAPRPTEYASGNGVVKENGPIGSFGNGTGGDPGESQPDLDANGPGRPAEAAQQRAQLGPVTDVPANPADDLGVDL